MYVCVYVCLGVRLVFCDDAKECMRHIGAPSRQVWQVHSSWRLHVCLYVRSSVCVCVWWEVLRHDEQSQEKYFDTWRLYLGVDRGHFHVVFFKLLERLEKYEIKIFM